MSLKQKLIKLAQNAREASRQIAGLSSQAKNRVLKEMALAIRRNKRAILRANKKDLSQAKGRGLSAAFLERLALNDKRIREMAHSLSAVAGLPEPVGAVIKQRKRPNGLKIKKVRTPIGVLAIIYESRPNVTADCAGLCFKSGNSVILRGGSDARHSNLAIFRALQSALRRNKISPAAVNLVAGGRKAIEALLKLDGYIDLVIPRGGEGLIRTVARLSRIPVIKHYKGICHVYVDDWADLNMAQEVCFNAKIQRPAVCNAMESMLVHQDVAVRFLPGMLKKFKEAGVEIRGCPLTQKIARAGIRRATEKDYHTEYLDLILSVKVVPDLEAAIGHINFYGSHHSDSIITDNKANARRFLREVDSACVYVNASTRFTDGYQFGMGAEIGISTDKLHARGPMALEELTTYKYMVVGNGQVRT